MGLLAEIWGLAVDVWQRVAVVWGRVAEVLEVVAEVSGVVAEVDIYYKSNTDLPALNQKCSVNVSEPQDDLIGRQLLQFDTTTTQKVRKTTKEFACRCLQRKGRQGERGQRERRGEQSHDITVKENKT